MRLHIREGVGMDSRQELREECNELAEQIYDLLEEAGVPFTVQGEVAKRIGRMKAAAFIGGATAMSA
jgi:hypothetical protein